MYSIKLSKLFNGWTGMTREEIEFSGLTMMYMGSWDPSFDRKFGYEPDVALRWWFFSIVILD